MTDAERKQALEQLSEQRWKDVESGTPTCPDQPMDEMPAGLDPISRESFFSENL